MTVVQHSVAIGAPLERVALLVAEFDLIADFHPQIASCDVDGEGVGATRRLWLGDGQLVEERLVEELRHGYVYEGVRRSDNLASWRGRIEVAARGEHSTATWTLELDTVEGVDRERLTIATKGMLEEGLASVKRQLEGLD